MWIYYVLFALILGLGYFLCEYKPSQAKKITYFIIMGLVLTLVVGLRYGIGYDYFTYGKIFDEIKALSFAKLFTGTTYEIGFALLCKMISLFTSSYLAFYLIFALCTIGPLMVFLYRYQYGWLMLFAYATMGLYYGSMNMMRQYLAATIVLWSLEFIQKKKFVPYLLIILLAASMHKSALIMIPVFFLALIPINWKTLTAYGVGVVVLLCTSDYIISWVTQYVYQSYNLQSIYMQPTTLLYAISPAVFMVIALVLKNKLLAKDAGNKVYLNLIIYYFITYLMLAKYLIVQRLSVYFAGALFLLIPQVLSLFEVPKSLTEKIASTKAQIKKATSTQSKILTAKLLEEKKQLKETRIFHGFAMGVLVFFCFIGTMFSMNQGDHRVFPYYSVFQYQDFIPGETNPNPVYQPVADEIARLFGE